MFTLRETLRKVFASLSLLLLGCGCVSVRESPPITREAPDAFALRYRFHPGEEVRYALRSSFVSHTLAEVPTTLSADHEAEFHLKVVEVLPGDRARIVVVLDRLRLVMSAPDQGTVVFDSDDRDALARCPKEIRGMTFLVGKEIEMQQTCWGEITGVGGLASIYRSAMEELSSDEIPRVELVLREMAHNPTALLGLDVVLPEGAARVGESWSADRGPFPTLCGRMAYRCEYLLKDVAEGRAVVRFKGGVGASEERPSLKLKQVKKAEVNGTFVFDLERGALTMMRGQSSLFLRVGANDRLREKCTWELTLRNKGFGETTEEPAKEDPGDE
jgi:hypothetical protein